MRFFRRTTHVAASDAPTEAPVTDPDEPQLEGEIEQKTEQALQRTKRGFFGRISGLFDRPGAFDESLWEELEELLLAADTGLVTAQTILASVRERIAQQRLKTPDEVREALKQTLLDILNTPQPKGQLWLDGEGAARPKPAVVLVLGVNGTGKTTTIAKLARAWQLEGGKAVIAAGDTFRAAAIDQLKEWGERIGADVVAHKPGADPGAVVYDALSAADSRGADIVIIDTAGRLHTKFNLMEELRKIKRVIERKEPTAPHEVLLVLDATTGQNALIQAQAFTEAVEVTAVCLTKLDGTSKGGIVFAICDQLGIPVRFVGTGEGEADIAIFSAEAFVEALFR
jgi:fused signal recognition particle receptor